MVAQTDGSDGPAFPLDGSFRPIDASSASPAEEALALPSAPIGANRDELAILSSVCAAGYTPSARGPVLGCRSHPPFERREALPDGTLPVHTGDPMKFCELTALYRGAFSRPGAVQAVLAFGPCYEGDTDGFESNAFNSESALLVEQNAGRFRVLRYEGSMHASTCKVSRREDLHDVLLCDTSFAAMSVGALHSFFLVDFSRHESPVHTFAAIFSDVFDCASFERSQFHLPNGLVETKGMRSELAVSATGGVSHFAVSVERARASPSPLLDAKLKRLCAQNPRTDGRSALPPFLRTKLEFMSQGNRSIPSDASHQVLAKWAAEAPENFNGLGDAAPPWLPP